VQVDTVASAAGGCRTLVTRQHIVISLQKVIAANIAPDESAIATASEDGVVYFHSLPNTE